MAGQRIERLKALYRKAKISLKKRGTRVFSKMPKPLQDTLVVTKNSITLFRSHDMGAMGSGLSYVTLFSIAPLLIIIISIVGLIFGPEAVTGQLRDQIAQLLGAGPADQLQSMVKAAYHPGKNWVAATISIFLLITGAIGVFDQLRNSLNVIWDVKPAAKKPFWTYLVHRLFSFGMVASIALLLIVSLALNTALSALSGYMNHLLPDLFKVLIVGIDFIVSFSLTTLLFVFIYRFLSDIRMSWRNVFYGAVFTSVLFAIGKYFVALYIGNSNIAGTFGAASSVIVVLLWVYYFSQILFFGAGFTRALADYRGIKIGGTQNPQLPKS